MTLKLRPIVWRSRPCRTSTFGVRKGARPDDDVEVAIADHLGELGVILDRRRKVGVGQEHETPPRFEHAVPDRVALAAVLAVGDDAAAPTGERLRGQLGRAVLRAVVDDEDLRVDAAGVEVRRDLPERERRAAPPRCTRERRSRETGGVNVELIGARLPSGDGQRPRSRRSGRRRRAARPARRKGAGTVRHRPSGRTRAGRSPRRSCRCARARRGSSSASHDPACVAAAIASTRTVS